MPSFNRKNFSLLSRSRHSLLDITFNVKMRGWILFSVIVAFSSRFFFSDESPTNFMRNMNERAAHNQKARERIAFPQLFSLSIPFFSLSSEQMHKRRIPVLRRCLRLLSLQMWRRNRLRRWQWRDELRFPSAQLPRRRVQVQRDAGRHGRTWWAMHPAAIQMRRRQRLRRLVGRGELPEKVDQLHL